MVYLEASPPDLRHEYSFLFNQNSLSFLADLIATFEADYDKILQERQNRAVTVSQGDFKPIFKNRHILSDWKINELPKKLQNRKLDLGDCAPSDKQHLVNALNADVQGVQLDFDDGFCPTWENIIQGIYNISQAARSKLPGMQKTIEKCPVLMMRPRAFNMIEHHCMIRGRKVPGALFDFALLMHHNGKLLSEMGVGPYFYLSKIESAEEAALWNKIFIWTQDKLNIPQGTIKACILIENILAAFEMEDILYAIKDHAIGLNCGIWDYSASIIQKFGHNEEYLIPDRNKYVNVGKTFLKNYMKLVVRVCHDHGALATGGMVAKLLPKDTKTEHYQNVKKAIQDGKASEIQLGVDGFLVFDMRAVEALKELWDQHTTKENQVHVLPNIAQVTPESLLKVPKGVVTIEGLRHNLNVSLLFIYHWLLGKGTFIYNQSVEDSATAEISRCQLWQWLRHKVPIENYENQLVIYPWLMKELQNEVYRASKRYCKLYIHKKLIMIAKSFLIEIITSRHPPEFITTYLNDILHSKLGHRLIGKL
ncbi:uncharacterized protein LOC134831994 [Culicoides brevitarsis]|uniref:uncharacterized protein LOC134831994 n=1 Tax=Culicoides brevitarsis TaxID=469753 RepID=UPI00307BE805